MKALQIKMILVLERIEVSKIKISHFWIRIVLSTIFTTEHLNSEELLILINTLTIASHSTKIYQPLPTELQIYFPRIIPSFSQHLVYSTKVQQKVQYKLILFIVMQIKLPPECLQRDSLKC